jgi:hypothetical protein
MEGKPVLTKKEDLIFKQFSWLVGKVLTQIEASTPDKVQRNSLKKIVETLIYDSRNELIMALSKLEEEDK